jgi:hypothetical protein
MADNKNKTKDTKKRFRKAGRTLLIKSVDEDFDFRTLSLEKFEGVSSNIETKSGARFIVFDDVKNAVTALKELKQDKDILVKYAHYRLYFTMNGLSDQSDYNNVKKSHIDYITEKTGTEVLYYKLYKKDKDSYLGCGDLTIDTKDGMDKLLQSESLKEYTLTVDKTDYTGQFYQFNKFKSTKFNSSDDFAGEVVKEKTAYANA